jgi:hypothetical protein
VDVENSTAVRVHQFGQSSRHSRIIAVARPNDAGFETGVAEPGGKFVIVEEKRLHLDTKFTELSTESENLGLYAPEELPGRKNGNRLTECVHHRRSVAHIVAGRYGLQDT